MRGLFDPVLRLAYIFQNAISNSTSSRVRGWLRLAYIFQNAIRLNKWNKQDPLLRLAYIFQNAIRVMLLIMELF